MYEAHFGFDEKPFSILPDPHFLYWGRGHKQAYTMLHYGVLNQAGITVISGEIGCGKTTLLHQLISELGDGVQTALLSNIRRDSGTLLSWALMAFDQPFDGDSAVAHFDRFQRFLIDLYRHGKRGVLIVDEAQNMSPAMLEELRMLSNINAGKDQLIQLVLVGQPPLLDQLNDPAMAQLAQRVSANFHLQPLPLADVMPYIENRTKLAGCQEPVFDADTAPVIHRATRGVPRLINILCDTALVYAYADAKPRVTAATINDVIKDRREFNIFGLGDQGLESGRSPRRGRRK